LCCRKKVLSEKRAVGVADVVFHRFSPGADQVVLGGHS